MHRLQTIALECLSRKSLKETKEVIKLMQELLVMHALMWVFFRMASKYLTPITFILIFVLCSVQFTYQDPSYTSLICFRCGSNCIGKGIDEGQAGNSIDANQAASMSLFRNFTDAKISGIQPCIISTNALLKFQVLRSVPKEEATSRRKIWAFILA